MKAVEDKCAKTRVCQDWMREGEGWMWENKGLHPKLCIRKQSEERRVVEWILVCPSEKKHQWCSAGRRQPLSMLGVRECRIWGQNSTVEMNKAQHGWSRSTRVLYIMYCKYSLYIMNAAGRMKWDGGKTIFSCFLWFSNVELALGTQNPCLDWQKLEFLVHFLPANCTYTNSTDLH